MGRSERATTAAEKPGPGCVAAMIGLGVVFTGLVGLFAAACNAIGNIGPIFSPPLSSPAEQPIPIPKGACPYLRAVHDTAADSGRLYWSAIAAPTGTRYAPISSPESWSRFRAQFGPSLARFDAALRRAIPRVPRRVASKLTVVLREVRIGEQNLATAPTFAAYNDGTSGSVVAGYVALGNASDLVGNACGLTVLPPIRP